MQRFIWVIVLLSLLGGLAAPLAADEPKEAPKALPKGSILSDDRPAEVPLMKADPNIEPMWRRPVELLTDPDRREDLVFVFLMAWTTSFGWGTFKSVLPENLEGAWKERRALRAALYKQQEELRSWAEHSHDLWPEFKAAEARVAELERKLKSPAKGQKARLEQELAEAEPILAKLKGRMENSPSAYSRIMQHLYELDKLDGALEKQFGQLHDLAASQRGGVVEALDAAIAQWKEGKGLYALERWMETAAGKRILETNGGQRWRAGFDKIMEDSGKHLVDAVNTYNEVIKAKNALVPESKTRPTITLRKTKSGYDTKTLDTGHYRRVEPPKRGSAEGEAAAAGAHSPTVTTDTGKTKVSFHYTHAEIKREDLKKRVDEECREGYETLAQDVSKSERRDRWYYTYRVQLGRAAGTLAGLVGFGGFDTYFRIRYKESVFVARQKFVKQSEEVGTVKSTLAGRMALDKKEDNNLGPFLDIATKVFARHEARVHDNIRDKLLKLPDASEKLARLEEVTKTLRAEKNPVRNNLERAVLLVLAGQQVVTPKQGVGVVTPTDEALAKTGSYKDVKSVVLEALSRNYSKLSLGDATLLMDEKTVLDLVDELVDTLEAETGAKVHDKPARSNPAAEVPSHPGTGSTSLDDKTLQRMQEPPLLDPKKGVSLTAPRSWDDLVGRGALQGLIPDSSVSLVSVEPALGPQPIHKPMLPIPPLK